MGSSVTVKKHFSTVFLCCEMSHGYRKKKVTWQLVKTNKMFLKWTDLTHAIYLGTIQLQSSRNTYRRLIVALVFWLPANPLWNPWSHINSPVSTPVTKDCLSKYLWERSSLVPPGNDVHVVAWFSTNIVSLIILPVITAELSLITSAFQFPSWNFIYGSKIIPPLNLYLLKDSVYFYCTNPNIFCKWSSLNSSESTEGMRRCIIAVYNNHFPDFPPLGLKVYTSSNISPNTFSQINVSTTHPHWLQYSRENVQLIVVYLYWWGRQVDFSIPRDTQISQLAALSKHQH